MLLDKRSRRSGLTGHFSKEGDINLYRREPRVFLLQMRRIFGCFLGELPPAPAQEQGDGHQQGKASRIVGLRNCVHSSFTPNWKWSTSASSGCLPIIFSGIISLSMKMMLALNSSRPLFGGPVTRAVIAMRFHLSRIINVCTAEKNFPWDHFYKGFLYLLCRALWNDCIRETASCR